MKGSCLCGAVAFEVQNARPTITICHCKMCRRWSGHLWSATRSAYADLTFLADETLRWFKSSDMAQRGFCSACGTSLFYRENGEDGIGIAAGCLDDPTGMTTGKHIFTAHAGDYYTIADDAPHFSD